MLPRYAMIQNAVDKSSAVLWQADQPIKAGYHVVIDDYHSNGISYSARIQDDVFSPNGEGGGGGGHRFRFWL